MSIRQEMRAVYEAADQLREMADEERSLTVTLCRSQRQALQNLRTSARRYEACASLFEAMVGLGQSFANVGMHEEATEILQIVGNEINPAIEAMKQAVASDVQDAFTRSTEYQTNIDKSSRLHLRAKHAKGSTARDLMGLEWQFRTSTRDVLHQEQLRLLAYVTDISFRRLQLHSLDEMTLQGAYQMWRMESWHEAYDRLERLDGIPGPPRTDMLSIWVEDGPTIVMSPLRTTTQEMEQAVVKAREQLKKLWANTQSSMDDVPVDSTDSDRLSEEENTAEAESVFDENLFGPEEDSTSDDSSDDEFDENGFYPDEADMANAEESDVERENVDEEENENDFSSGDIDLSGLNNPFGFDLPHTVDGELHHLDITTGGPHISGANNSLEDPDSLYDEIDPFGLGPRVEMYQEQCLDEEGFGEFDIDPDFIHFPDAPVVNVNTSVSIADTVDDPLYD